MDCMRAPWNPNYPYSLTKSRLGSWMDHSRDLFLMINHFRDQMPRPIVGLGHSFGGNVMFVPVSWTQQ